MKTNSNIRFVKLSSIEGHGYHVETNHTRIGTVRRNDRVSTWIATTTDGSHTIPGNTRRDAAESLAQHCAAFAAYTARAVA